MGGLGKGLLVSDYKRVRPRPYVRTAQEVVGSANPDRARGGVYIALDRPVHAPETADGTTAPGDWDTETSGQTESAGGDAKTTAELQSPTGYAGPYADWNVDLDGDGSSDDPWKFGSATEYPVLNLGTLDIDHGNLNPRPPR